MDNEKLLNISVVKNLDTLSEFQKSEFYKIIMEGLKGKLTCALQDNTQEMYKLVTMWAEMGLLPLDETFSAVDSKTGDVIAIILLNNFRKTNSFDMLKSICKSIGIIGMKKTFKIFFAFAALDNYNKVIENSNIVSEIYLVATREDLRGQGIGKFLLEYVLDYLHVKCKCSTRDKCTCRVKLLAYDGSYALKLYEKLGFKQVGYIPTPKLVKAFGPEYGALIRMEKPIFD